MSDWGKINQLIDECKRRSDPLSCLEALFASTDDGNAAFAIGELLVRRGRSGGAVEWFERAEERFPLAGYKAKARAAAEGARSATRDSEPHRPPGRVVPPDDVLYVVSCTKAKVWDDPASGAARFEPAERAYTGSYPTRWHASPEYQAGARWLFLSAKYGFIEPDHPIRYYDVTFSDPSTGPISEESLAAQAAHQTRWDDRRRLRDFGRVCVLGSAIYLEKTRAAFSPLGIPVVEYRSRAPSRDESTSGVGVTRTRAQAIGAALGAIPPYVWHRIDEEEPEWPVLGLVAELPPGLDVLTAIALGLTDYQLGDGGASRYWEEAGLLLEKGPPASDGDLLEFMRALVARPVSSRLGEQKLVRIERLLSSSVPGWIAGRDVTALGPHGFELWRLLAQGMNQDMQAKTVSFAMKVVDLLHLKKTGSYIAFPEATIPVDLRIARVSLSSGLIAPTGTVSQEMERADAVADENRDTLVVAWAGVAACASPISVFRIDSLVWQLGEPLYGERHDAGRARRAITERLLAVGASAGCATRVAQELTAALE